MENVLYFIELNDGKGKLNEYLRYIDAISLERKMEISKFKCEMDGKLNLFSHLLVRYLACTVLGLNNVELSFEKNIYGKPYLTGFPSFNYNISHTRNAIALGISDKPIGIDIEKIRVIDYKIADRFFCKNELEYILSNIENQESLFFEIWTKKEAYIKWMGKGLSIPLTSFDVTSVEMEKRLSLFRLGDYIISVCCENNFHNAGFVMLKENQVCQIFTEFLKSGSFSLCST